MTDHSAALTASDRVFLEAAAQWAQPAIFHTSPNPAVGCLLVRGHEVIGRGRTEPAGGRHAEVVALDHARAQGHDPAGATAYVSLEPCAFEGRTPACADTLARVGIARVVGALTDPHPRVAGAGYARLRAAGVAVATAELDLAAANVRGFVHRHRHGRPFVRLKVGASLDGRTAMASGESQWITGPAARADVQYWRARSCAVVTGSGTVRDDDPQLNVRDERFARDGALRQPLRVVLDSQGTLSGRARIFTPGTEALRVTGPGVDRTSDGAAMPQVELPLTTVGGVDLAALLRLLADRECNEVLVEAGPRLIGAFLASGLWDEALIYLAPKVLGSDARPLASVAIQRLAAAITGTIAAVEPIGDDLRLQFKNNQPVLQLPASSEE
ncbi:MAG: bifunctional diaminohydroxyphosphoribosylaminopyrimidine deaminase/5-amino-6-(5-phosphoribosylamino)uracil reductase RibD [Pseudomonadota bacterium]